MLTVTDLMKQGVIIPEFLRKSKPLSFRTENLDGKNSLTPILPKTSSVFISFLSERMKVKPINTTFALWMFREEEEDATNYQILE
jgi:hypothetical protein